MMSQKIKMKLITKMYITTINVMLNKLKELFILYLRKPLILKVLGEKQIRSFVEAKGIYTKIFRYICFTQI